MSKSIFLTVLLAVIVLFGYSQNKIVSGVISKYDESNVVLAPDGNTLYFTFSNHVLNRGGKNDKGDIWYSTYLGDAGWSAPSRIVGPVNNHLNNRVLGFSPDGKTMFLHGQYGKGNKASTTRGISKSVWNGRLWSEPENLSIPSFKNASNEQGGYISPDGSVLLLSIDSYGSKGNEDIYVSFNNGSSWTEPVNLGNTINSAYQEFTPYLSDNKKVLFFSTNGRGGEGSSDVFFSHRLDDSWTNWSEPQNIGPEYNGAGKDYNFFMVDKLKKVLWVTLNNSDEYGEIRMAEPIPELDSLFTEQEEQVEQPEILEDQNIVLFGKVTDQAGQPLVGVDVLLKIGQEVLTINTDQNGGYSFGNIAGNARVNVSEPSYIPQSEQVNLVLNTARELNFNLMPVEVGVTVNLTNVLFKRGTADFLTGSTEALETVVELMENNPNLRIELGGHTDNTGIARKNIKLSKKRVKTVENYLIKQGISSSRIEGKGYGGEKPIASNASEATRKLNRRVEFTIISN